MKRSLPAFYFKSVFTPVFPLLRILILFLLLIYPVIKAQDALHSAGPAPIIKISHQEPAPFTIGTRAFLQLSISPNVQFAKSFMESCTITNVGAPSTITSSGGLVIRNGIVYTWNQSSPFYIWQIDTVTGVRTLTFTFTGVPLSNLTGMCWDGTTMYGVSTNGSSSQLLSFNMITGVCIPIGSPTTICSYAALIFGRQFSGSSLFSADIISDNIYRWNKTTGTATLFDAAGFNVLIGEDASFDGNYCYWVAGNQLRRWDTMGTNTVLCTYIPGQAIGIECVTVSTPSPGTALTLCRNGMNVAVPDASTTGARDTIKVIGYLSTHVWDVNVRIDTFSHTWISDMQFTLTHNGTNPVNLFLNRGSSGDNIIRCEFNDSALAPISSGTAPFTGIFRPEQPLTVYNGEVLNGNWILFMEDQFAGDIGTLKAWCIVFNYSWIDGGIKTIEIPFTYRLYQNYPNPFNPVTIIKYGLPKYGDTKLVVYNITGQVVSTLVNEFKDSGTYEVQWDASNFSSGIYFYTLESGNYKETKKMMIIK